MTSIKQTKPQDPWDEIRRPDWDGKAHSFVAQMRTANGKPWASPYCEVCGGCRSGFQHSGLTRLR